MMHLDYDTPLSYQNIFSGMFAVEINPINLILKPNFSNFYCLNRIETNLDKPKVIWIINF